MTGKCVELKIFNNLFFKFDEWFRFKKWDKLLMIKEVVYLRLITMFCPNMGKIELTIHSLRNVVCQY